MRKRCNVSLSERTIRLLDNLAYYYTLDRSHVIEYLLYEYLDKNPEIEDKLINNISKDNGIPRGIYLKIFQS